MCEKMNRILIVVVFLGLVGCDKPPVKHETQIPRHTEEIVGYSYYDGTGVRRFTFSDGVDCVSRFNAGLACDFPVGEK